MEGNYPGRRQRDQALSTDQSNGWTSLVTTPRRGSGEAKFVGYQCIPVGCPDEHHLYSDEPAEINVLVRSESTREVDSLAVTFYDRAGTKLVNADIRFHSARACASRRART